MSLGIPSAAYETDTLRPFGGTGTGKNHTHETQTYGTGSIQRVAICPACLIDWFDFPFLKGAP